MNLGYTSYFRSRITMRFHCNKLSYTFFFLMLTNTAPYIKCTHYQNNIDTSQLKLNSKINNSLSSTTLWADVGQLIAPPPTPIRHAFVLFATLYIHFETTFKTIPTSKKNQELCTLFFLLTLFHRIFMSFRKSNRNNRKNRNIQVQ